MISVPKEMREKQGKRENRERPAMKDSKVNRVSKGKPEDPVMTETSDHRVKRENRVRREILARMVRGD